MRTRRDSVALLVVDLLVQLYFSGPVCTIRVPKNQPWSQVKIQITARNSYGVGIFITCLQSLRLTPQLRAAETSSNDLVGRSKILGFVIVRN